MAKENTASTTDQVSPVKDVEQKNPATPVPEVSEVKPEPPANEGPSALFEMAEGPSGPGKKEIPSPENVVIPFEKINEIKAKKEAASGKAAKAVEDKQPKPSAKDTVKKEPPAPAKAPKQSKGPQGQSPGESRASGLQSRAPGQGRACGSPALPGSGAGRIHQAVGAAPLQKSSVPGPGR